MPKVKMALFFHTDNEEEKKAYELLCSMGRKKSMVITGLVNRHTEELAEYAGQKARKEKPQKAMPVSEKDGTQFHYEKKVPEVVPVRAEKEENMLPVPDTEKEQDKDAWHGQKIAVPENEIQTGKQPQINGGLVLKGLAAFR